MLINEHELLLHDFTGFNATAFSMETPQPGFKWLAMSEKETHLISITFRLTLYDMLLVKSACFRAYVFYLQLAQIAGYADVNTNGVLLPSAGCLWDMNLINNSDIELVFPSLINLSIGWKKTGTTSVIWDWGDSWQTCYKNMRSFQKLK